MKRENVKIIIFLIPVLLGMSSETFSILYGINSGEAWEIMLDYPEEFLLDEAQRGEMLARRRGVGPVEGYFRAGDLLASLSLVAALMFSLLALIGKLSWKIVIVIVLDWLVAVFVFVGSGVRT